MYRRHLPKPITPEAICYQIARATAAIAWLESEGRSAEYERLTLQRWEAALAALSVPA